MANECQWTDAKHYGMASTDFGRWCAAWVRRVRLDPADVTDHAAAEARRKFNDMVPAAVVALLGVLADSLAYDMEPDTPRELLAGLANCLPHQLSRQWPEDWRECDAPRPGSPGGLKCGETVAVGGYCRRCGRKVK